MAYAAFELGETIDCIPIHMAGVGVQSMRFPPIRPDRTPSPMEAFFISTAIVALAEMGDKTQIATVMLAAKYNAYLKRAPRSEDEYAMALYNLGYCDFSRKDMAERAVRSRSSSKPIRPATATAPMPTTGWATSAIPTANLKRPWGITTVPLR